MLVLLSPDLAVIGIRMGMCFSFAGFGLLIGAPIAGTILRSDFGFSGLGAFSGATTLAGFIFISLAFFVHRWQLASNTKSMDYPERKRNNINAVYRVRGATERARGRR